MRTQLHLFLLALSFYTRVPVPQGLNYAELPKAAIYLPLVGWLVGAVCGVCFYLCNLVWPQTVAVIMALTAGVLLTGGFHEDGFADVCDGFGGGYGKTQILEIMKDSRIGTYGSLGLMLLTAAKISVLSALPAASLPAVLIAGHGLSRFPPLLLLHRYHYTRVGESKAGLAVYRPSFSELGFSGFIAVLPLLLLPLLFSALVPLILLVNLFLGQMFFRQIGGYTGDCLGASQQIAETAFYLGVSALWTFS